MKHFQLFLFIFFSSCLFISNEKYCLSEGKCITVMNMKNGMCKVYPGEIDVKNPPPNGYIYTSRTQYIAFYFSDRIPNCIFVENQSHHNLNSTFQLVGPFNNILKFVDVSTEGKSMLYKTDTSRVFQEGINYIDLNLHEHYGVDRSGKIINPKHILKW